MCGFRKLILVRKKDCFPLPRLHDSLESLAVSKYFSYLALLRGYQQVEVAREDRKKTAFVTHFWQGQYRVMSFGIRNAPATFQRLISIVLKGQLGNIFLAYLDDILIFTRMYTEHGQRLRLVFDRLGGCGS